MAELAQRRHLRTVREPLSRGGGERQQPAGAHVLGRDRPREHADLHVTGDEIEHGLRAALVGDVHQLDLFLCRQELGDPIAHRAKSGRDIFQAFGLARQRQKIRVGRHAERWMRKQHVGRSAEIRDMREVAHGIEADVLVHRRPEHMGGDARYHEREPVGLCARDCLGTEKSTAADPVLDIERLAEGRAERLGIEPADRVGRAARGERHDEPHRFARPFRAQRGGQRDSRGKAEEDDAARCGHSILLDTLLAHDAAPARELIAQYFPKFGARGRRRHGAGLQERLAHVESFEHSDDRVV